MTYEFKRFLSELSGERGDFWKRDAEKRLESFRNDAKEGNVLFDEDGAARWKTNNRYIPHDVAEIMEYAGIAINVVATQQKRDAQESAEIAEYRKAMANHIPSEEELYEMRAAFGEGTTVVNVLTGQRYEI